jgi:ABC-type dipeptide/oligopeptide/nickel transport system permease component
VIIAVVVFFIITFVAFSIPEIYDNFNPNREAPGLGILNMPRTPKIQSFIDQYHLDDPYVTRYFYWLGNFFTGDWGNSLVKRVPVWDMVF